MDKGTVTRISKILNPTEEQKEKIFYSILEKSKNITIERKGHRLMKRLRPVVVAVIMSCFLIATTAFAAVYLGLDIGFFNFLRLSNNEQAEYLGNGAYNVNQQVVNKNGTLRIKQVIGDSNLTYILMDFIAPEDVVLNADRYRFDTYVDVDSYNGSYGYGFTKLEDENTNDNKISLVMTFNTQKSLMGRNMKLIMKDLEAAANLPKTFKEATTVDPDAQVFKSQIHGSWETSFKLDFKDYSRTFEPNQKLMLYGYEATLQSIAVSPISITIKFESPYTREINNASSSEAVEYNTYLDDFPVTINYKDGTKETTTYLTGMTVGDNLSKTTVSVKKFEKVINDKDIESIEFFDTVITIN